MARWKVATAAGTRMDGRTDGQREAVVFFASSGGRSRRHGGIVFGESDLKPFETFSPLSFASCDCTDLCFIIL